MTKLEHAIASAKEDFAKINNIPKEHILYVTSATDPHQYEYWLDDILWFDTGGFKVPKGAHLNVQVYFDTEAPDVEGEPQYSIFCEIMGGNPTYTVVRINWGVEHRIDYVSTIL